VEAVGAAVLLAVLVMNWLKGRGAARSEPA